MVVFGALDLLGLGLELELGRELFLFVLGLTELELGRELELIRIVLLLLLLLLLLILIVLVGLWRTWGFVVLVGFVRIVRLFGKYVRLSDVLPSETEMDLDLLELE